MKNFTRKFTAVFLAALITLSPITSSALYRGVLGDVYYIKSSQLASGVDFTEYHSITDGLNERAYVFEYRPSENALPIVSFGDSLTGSSKVTTLAKHEQKNGFSIIGGVNGDFYSFATGVPLGTAIREGRLITDDDKNNAVGFTEDGETIFGNPEISFTVKHTYVYSSERASTISLDNDNENSEVSTDTEELLQGEIGNYFYEDDESSEIDSSIDTTEDEESDTIEENSEEIDDDMKEEDSEVSEETENTEDTEDAEHLQEPEYEEGEDVTDILPVSYFNKYPTEWGAYLLDDLFSTSTKSQKESLEVVIKLDDPEAYAELGKSLTGVISAIHPGTKNTPIEKGHLVISVCETSVMRPEYSNIAVGDKIEISFTCAEGWENIVSAIGGSDVFIKDGQIDRSVINESSEKTANPRTAVGVRADGTVILFVADGRQDISYGFRLVSLAETLLSFGCVYAINLDGGGSSTAVVKFPGQDNAVIVNSPSDKSERSVSNALLLVDTSESDNTPRYIIPEDASPIILKGESFTFENLRVTDSSLSDVEFENPSDKAEFLNNLTLSFDESRLSYYSDKEEKPLLGSFSEDKKTYIADGDSGEIPLVLTSEYNGTTITGRALLFVTNEPDNIVSSLDSTIFIGNTSLKLDFDAYYMGHQIPSNPSQVTYTLLDDIVNNYAEDNTAPENALAVSDLGYVSEDGFFIPFENADGSLLLTIEHDSKELSSTNIIIGSGSLKVMGEDIIPYDFTTEESEDVELPYVSVLEKVESLDIYTGNNDLSIYAKVVDSEEEMHKINYTLQNEPTDNGLYHYRAEIRGNYEYVVSPVYIDAEENFEHSGEFALNSVHISYTDTETVFYDTFNHWAKTNVNTLYRLGIVGGESSDNGLVFAPERSLSRAEFAVMISRTLGYNTEEYSDTLIFDDAESIPTWAMGHISAVSANGLMNGKSMPDGTLIFDASGKITRQEIMQVIGNLIKSLEANEEETEDEESDSTDETTDEIIEEVETEISKPTFADIDSVAAWAYDNVLLTLETGIITGYGDNTLKPLNNVTRAEAATVILRSSNYIEDLIS